MQETYKLNDLIKLARQKPSLLKDTSNEEFRSLQEQYNKKFGFYLDTWLIGREREEYLNLFSDIALRQGYPWAMTNAHQDAIFRIL